MCTGIFEFYNFLMIAFYLYINRHNMTTPSTTTTTLFHLPTPPISTSTTTSFLNMNVDDTTQGL